MACAACARSKKGDGYTHYEALQIPPFNANDIQLLQNHVVKRLAAEDWQNDRHKLLLFYPDVNAPACADEFNVMAEWVKSFDDLGCDLYLASTDQIHIMQDMIESQPELASSGIKALSSYLLPTRLTIMHNGRSMHASVFITKEADVVIQQHFTKVGRPISELHRMLFGHVSASRCTHEWQDPSIKFKAVQDDSITAV